MKTISQRIIQIYVPIYIIGDILIPTLINYQTIPRFRLSNKEKN